MEPNTIYIIAGAAILLFLILFVITKVVGCGFKILKALIFLAIIGFVIYYVSMFFIK